MHSLRENSQTLTEGTVFSNLVKLNVFREYYQSLYNLQINIPPDQLVQKQQPIREYLASSGLPSFPDFESEALNAPISIDEYTRAISTLKPHKAPGPDGYTVVYYKAFTSTLGPRFIKAFNSLLEDRPLPIDTLRAHIVVIPKEGKDHAQCKNYRPISLLNVDLKIFTRILATRLQSLLQNVIHPDQVGFMPTKEAKDNTIRALAIIHMAHSRNIPLCLLSSDAEKAFDRVDWIFLKETLSHIGVGKAFSK